jgi:hypothetical protein
MTFWLGALGLLAFGMAIAALMIAAGRRGDDLDFSRCRGRDECRECLQASALPRDGAIGPSDVPEDDNSTRVRPLQRHARARFYMHEIPPAENVLNLVGRKRGTR